MKLKSILLIPALAALSLTACQQDPVTTIDYYFCATTPPGEAPWKLYIDGDYQGELPYLSAAPYCTDSVALAGMLQLTLDESRHDYEMKDAQGNRRASGYFRVQDDPNTDKGRSGGGTGGATLSWSCGIVIMSIFE